MSDQLTVQAEIQAIKSDWPRIVRGESRSYPALKSEMLDWVDGVMSIRKIIRSHKADMFFKIEYRDPGDGSPLKHSNLAGPTVCQVYQHLITTIIYKKEKQEVK